MITSNIIALTLVFLTLLQQYISIVAQDIIKAEPGYEYHLMDGYVYELNLIKKATWNVKVM